jgi:hypothetical protein
VEHRERGNGEEREIWRREGKMEKRGK